MYSSANQPSHFRKDISSASFILREDLMCFIAYYQCLSSFLRTEIYFLTSLSIFCSLTIFLNKSFIANSYIFLYHFNTFPDFSNSLNTRYSSYSQVVNGI
eukprot:NODE_63_length_25098_cov_0.440498.p23 type:complete len:100 gc:universal NODE_63_length_25098_cov_0.440498:20674-20973(+)